MHLYLKISAGRKQKVLSKIILHIFNFPSCKSNILCAKLFLIFWTSVPLCHIFCNYLTKGKIFWRKKYLFIRKFCFNFRTNFVKLFCDQE